MSNRDAETGLETVSDLNRQYSTFTAGGLFLGIEVLRVQEVLRYLEMTKIPSAPT